MKKKPIVKSLSQVSGVCGGVLFLITDWYGRVPSTMDSAIPGLAVLDYIRKQAEQTMRNNHHTKYHCVILAYMFRIVTYSLRVTDHTM